MFDNFNTNSMNKTIAHLLFLLNTFSAMMWQPCNFNYQTMFAKRISHFTFLVQTQNNATTIIYFLSRMLCLRGVRRLRVLKAALSSDVSVTHQSTGTTLQEKHLVDPEGVDLPLTRFLRAQTDKNEGLKYVESPVVSSRNHVIIIF